MQTLLMATDLSARSDRALDRAVALAAAEGAALTVLHVVDDDLPASVIEAQTRAAGRAIDERLRATRGIDAIQSEVEIATGRPDVAIASAAGRSAADLVIIGSHRDRPVADLFRGTTAERLLRASPVPVLLVKTPAEEDYRRLLVAVDFSPAAKHAVEVAAQLLPASELEIVHAYQIPFEGFLKDDDTTQQVVARAEAEMQAFIADLDLGAGQVPCVLQEGEVRAVLYDLVARRQSDLMVIGTHGRTGVRRAILGSVAEDLLRAPPIDVLVVNSE